MDSVRKSNTRPLRIAHPGTNIIDCKWVIRIKTDNNGKRKFKTRLVARGFLQKQAIDNRETFAPLVRHDTIRLILTNAAENSEMAQFEVTTAFVHGHLKGVIYMK